MAAKQFYLNLNAAFTSNGLPAAGARLYFYISGGLTPVDVYTTSGLNIAHPFPVVANGAGRFPTIYTNDTSNLRVIIKDADGTLLDDQDPYIPGTAGSPGTPGTNAATPNWTIATGAAGTNVVITGTYPTQTITIPRGTPGSSGALTDSTYGDIIVSGTGSVLTVGAGAITLAKMANMATASFLGRQTAGTGAPEVLSAAGARTVLSLGNVDNTSDANKPVSTAQAAAIAAVPSRPVVSTVSASFSAADADNNTHKVASGASQTLTLGSLTAGTAFTIRFTTAWSLAVAGGLSKNGVAPGGVTTGAVAANSLITFLHEGSGVWVATGSGLT